MDFGSGGGVPRGGAGRQGGRWGGVLLGQEVECEPLGCESRGVVEGEEQRGFQDPGRLGSPQTPGFRGRSSCG